MGVVREGYGVIPTKHHHLYKGETIMAVAKKNEKVTSDDKAVKKLEAAKKKFAKAQENFQKKRQAIQKANRLIATGDKKLQTLEKKIEETKDAPAKATEMLLKKAEEMEKKAAEMDAKQEETLAKAAEIEAALEKKTEQLAKEKDLADKKLEELGVPKGTSRIASMGSSTGRRQKNNFQYRLKSKEWEMGYNIKGRIESAKKYGLTVTFGQDDYTVEGGSLAEPFVHAYGEGALASIASVVKEHGEGVE
jgi:chromosome segregation ATPase